MSIFDKAKQKAEELVDMVKDKLDSGDKNPGAPDGADSSVGTPAPDTDAGDIPHTAPSPDAVTPADVAESVSDPDLPHPEPPAEH